MWFFTRQNFNEYKTVFSHLWFAERSSYHHRIRIWQAQTRARTWTWIVRPHVRAFLFRLENPELRTWLYRTKSSATEEANIWERTFQHLSKTFEIKWYLDLHHWYGWFQLFVLPDIESMSSVPASKISRHINYVFFFCSIPSDNTV